MSRKLTLYKIISVIFLILLPGCGTAPKARQTTIDEDIIKKIDIAVFEVVIPKPAEDSLTYEKELPLDLLPYSDRNDRYYSIGTAFAIEKNRFISAAHVVQLNYRSQFKNFYLRDKNKNLYEIDNIYKYSSHRDYVEFSVRGDINIKTPLKTNKNPELNSNIYAVGNAYGEGVIIREGILTSRTPEDENGAWQWLRFSAAASPGNSGGPLLDSSGDVIGIVLRKSENENLNYALPIDELNRDRKLTAIDHMRMMYSLLNVTRKKVFTYHYETKLPENYFYLRENLLASREKYMQESHNQFIDSFKDNLFPRGKGSRNVLYFTNTKSFPGLICEDKNGEWGVYYPEIKTIDLENGGYIEAGVMTDLVFIKTQNPRGVKLKDILENPEIHMNQVLKALPAHRTIMNNDIRILSYGKPADKFIYSDNYDRKWIVSTWYTQYDDTRIVTFTTPVPGGTFTMLSQTSTGTDYMIDLKYITDFIHISYTGTFLEWKNFLRLKKYTPGIFRTIKFKYKKNRGVVYKSKRVYFKYDNSLQDISMNSVMALNFAYFSESGKIKWDINQIIVGEDKNNGTCFYISKLLKPAKGLDEAYISDWKKIRSTGYPFDRTPYFDDNTTIIKSVYKPGDKNADYLYTLGYIYDGKQKESVMKNKIKIISGIFKFE